MNITEAIAEVNAKKTTKERTEVIKSLLEKTPNWKTPAGRTEMHQRALFFTALRERKLWPPKPPKRKETELV